MKYLIYYLIIINIISLLVMYYDKSRALRHKWRVPERQLFLLALIFGSPGILGGMYIFRHKTKHSKFVYGIPAILIAQVILLGAVLNHF